MKRNVVQEAPLAVAVAFWHQGFDDERIIWGRCWRFFFDVPLEIDQLYGVDFQFSAQQRNDLQCNHHTTGAKHCVVFLVEDDQLIDAHLVEPVHFDGSHLYTGVQFFAHFLTNVGFDGDARKVEMRDDVQAQHDCKHRDGHDVH